MSVTRRLVWGIVATTSLALWLPLGGALAATGPSAPETVVTLRALSIDRPAAHATQVATAKPATTSVAPAPAAPAAPAAPSAPVAAAAPAPACPGNISGATGSAPAVTSPGGVAGTTTADLAAFAAAYNATRVTNCLPPVPLANFRYDACMEQRLFWIAEDPSTDTASAWGHIGTVRSDGVPSVGCDGNLAGGMNNTGATFAKKWWDSAPHRTSLYKPTETGSTATVCIYFAVTHGGVPDEPAAFTRAAARWGAC